MPGITTMIHITLLLEVELISSLAMATLSLIYELPQELQYGLEMKEQEFLTSSPYPLITTILKLFPDDDFSLLSSFCPSLS